jgi:hypothetical protein
MSYNSQEEESAVNDTDPNVADTAVEAVEAVEAPAPVAAPADAAPVFPAVNPPCVPSTVLIGVFTKRTVAGIDPVLWANAVDAVKQGRTVVLRGFPPHIDITDDVFTSEGKLPAGVASPTGLLNNLLVGMV